MQLKNLLSEGTMYGIGEKELLFIVIPIICSILSYSFAKKKGRSAWGWALASLFIPPHDCNPCTQSYSENSRTRRQGSMPVL